MVIDVGMTPGGRAIVEDAGDVEVAAHRGHGPGERGAGGGGAGGGRVAAGVGHRVHAHGVAGDRRVGVQVEVFELERRSRVAEELAGAGPRHAGVAEAQVALLELDGAGSEERIRSSHSSPSAAPTVLTSEPALMNSGAVGSSG